MEQEIGIYDAKTHFSRLVQEVASGEEFVVTRSGEPVARIIPFEKEKKRRPFGTAEGQVNLGKSFFDPLPDDILEAFGF